MSIKPQTIPANPLRHLRSNLSYRDAYEKEIKNYMGRSWEIRLFQWAEKGGTLSKICRWAVVFFSVAPVFAALRDKIKNISFGKAVFTTFNITASINQILFSNKNRELDPSIKKIIANYEPTNIHKGRDEEYGLDGSDNQGVIAGDPRKKQIFISEERRASLFATLNREDYSDLIPVAQRHIEKQFKCGKVQLIDKGSAMEVTSEKDAQGNKYLKCTKAFQIAAKNGSKLFGIVIIERNFNPATEDSVTFKYHMLDSDIDFDSELP